MSKTSVKSAGPYCGVSCGVVMAIAAGRMAQEKRHVRDVY